MHHFEVVPRLTDVSSESFPSGHSALSAAVYLTLGSLLAQLSDQQLNDAFRAAGYSATEIAYFTQKVRERIVDLNNL